MQPVVLLVPGMSKPFAWASLGSPTEEFAVLQAGREQQSESKRLAGGNQRASGKRRRAQVSGLKAQSLSARHSLMLLDCISVPCERKQNSKHVEQSRGRITKG